MIRCNNNKFDVIRDPRKTFSIKNLCRRGDLLVCGEGDPVDFTVEEGVEGKVHLKTKAGQYVVSHNQKVCLKSVGNKLEVA